MSNGKWVQIDKREVPYLWDFELVRVITDSPPVRVMRLGEGIRAKLSSGRKIPPRIDIGKNPHYAVVNGRKGVLYLCSECWAYSVRLGGEPITLKASDLRVYCPDDHYGGIMAGGSRYKIPLNDIKALLVYREK